MIRINSKGKLYEFTKPVVMGILNATPDSFFVHSLHEATEQIIEKVHKWRAHGMEIIDVGGQSTRPGSIRISMQEETDRVVPVIEEIHKAFPDILISVDTYQSGVARAAVNAGAHIINDVSGGELDETMIPTVADLKVPYILMHMQGTPETMQQNPTYQNVTEEIIQYLAQKIEYAQRCGVHDIWIDPGFGFGKTTAHNFTILKNLEAFKVLEKPILAGLSRKRMICETLHINPEEALNGTTVLNTMALMHGANILRVHDVKEACETVKLFMEMELK